MGKRLCYAEKIKESISHLKKIEANQTDALLRNRVKFIRLLKDGSANTQKESAKQIGVCERQGQKNWRYYKEGGLEGLIAPVPKGGRKGKLNESEFAELKIYLLENKICFLYEAVSHVKEKYHKDYSLAGMHFVFKGLG